MQTYFSWLHDKITDPNFKTIFTCDDAGLTFLKNYIFTHPPTLPTKAPTPPQLSCKVSIIFLGCIDRVWLKPYINF